MPKRLTAATVITVAVALSACSGGSDDGGTADLTPVTAASTTVSTEPAPTEPTTSPSPTTTANTITEPTSTTTEPAPTTTELSVEDQVRAASASAYDNYWACLRSPGDCDVQAWNLEGSDAFNAQTATLAELVEGGFYVGDEDVGYMVIESIEVKDDHTAVTSCWWATGVLYLQPSVDGAEPTIQNDQKESGRQIDEFVQDPDDGVWKIRRSDILSTTVGENECPAEQ